VVLDIHQARSIPADHPRAGAIILPDQAPGRQWEALQWEALHPWVEVLHLADHRHREAAMHQVVAEDHLPAEEDKTINVISHIFSSFW
jgi:hypothetical protein